MGRDYTAQNSSSVNPGLPLDPGSTICLGVDPNQGPKRPHKHKDPMHHDFSYPPHIGPWNQDVRSLCFLVFLAPMDYGSQLGLGNFMKGPVF